MLTSHDETSDDKEKKDWAAAMSTRRTSKPRRERISVGSSLLTGRSPHPSLFASSLSGQRLRSSLTLGGDVDETSLFESMRFTLLGDNFVQTLGDGDGDVIAEAAMADGNSAEKSVPQSTDRMPSETEEMEACWDGTEEGEEEDGVADLSSIPGFASPQHVKDKRGTVTLTTSNIAKDARGKSLFRAFNGTMSPFEIMNSMGRGGTSRMFARGKSRLADLSSVGRFFSKGSTLERATAFTKTAAAYERNGRLSVGGTYHSMSSIADEFGARNNREHPGKSRDIICVIFLYMRVVF